MNDENDKNLPLLYIEFLNQQICFYQGYIKYLKDNKPFFFQRKKMIKYNNKLKECEDKINEAYHKIGREIDWC